MIIKWLLIDFSSINLSSSNPVSVIVFFVVLWWPRWLEDKAIAITGPPLQCSKLHKSDVSFATRNASQPSSSSGLFVRCVPAISMPPVSSSTRNASFPSSGHRLPLFQIAWAGSTMHHSSLGKAMNWTGSRKVRVLGSIFASTTKKALNLMNVNDFLHIGE
jgi:hypothetical protein